MVNKNKDIFSAALDDLRVKLPELAKSSYGDLELSKTLYETRLQNIFNDYQNSIASLSQEEQKNIQDAYFVNELSKKYLGEYASNVGVGDVSGNLLDIYSAYQKNIGDINKYYDTLRMNLTNEYNNARFENLQNTLMADYGIEVAKLNEKTQQIMHDLVYGNTGDVDPMQYLESKRSEIGESNYRAIYEALFQQQQQQGNYKFDDIMNPSSENYVGKDYDFKLRTGENVDNTSVGFIDQAGNKKFSIIEDADNDAKYDMSGENLFKIFDEYYKDGKVDHSVPVQGDIIATRAYNYETNSTESVEYIYHNGTWHRLVGEKKNSLETEKMKLWRLGKKNGDVDLEDVKMKKSGGIFETTISIDYNGAAWSTDIEKSDDIVANINSNFKVYNYNGKSGISGKDEAQKIADYIRNIHGDMGSKETVFALYEGKMYALYKNYKGYYELYKLRRD